MEDRAQYVVPRTIKVLKELVLEKHSLQEQYRVLSQRLRKGIDFLRNQSLDHATRIRASEQFADIVSQLESVNHRTIQIDVEITTILEAKFTEIGFVVQVDRGENSLREIIDSSQVYCLPWGSKTSEEVAVLNPEDIWFLSRVKSIFGVSPHDIQLLAKE